MEKAKEYGCESFVLFSNTPPVYYTYNGQARSDKGSSSNLKTEHYGDFADFLATCAKHFVDEGYSISYISPVNEPQYNWNGNEQEGSAWQIWTNHNFHLHLSKNSQRAVPSYLKQCHSHLLVLPNLLPD